MQMAKRSKGGPRKRAVPVPRQPAEDSDSTRALAKEVYERLKATRKRVADHSPPQVDP